MTSLIWKAYLQLGSLLSAALLIHVFLLLEPDPSQYSVHNTAANGLNHMRSLEFLFRDCMYCQKTNLFGELITKFAL